MRVTSKLELIVEPEELQVVRNRADATKEVLIKWKNLPLFEATWEEANLISTRFPNFHLEDKVCLLGGSDVMDRTTKPLIHLVYNRTGRDKKRQQQPCKSQKATSSSWCKGRYHNMSSRCSRRQITINVAY